MQDSKNLGGPLAARRTIYGSHTWSGGTIHGNKNCHKWSGGTICGVTPPAAVAIHCCIGQDVVEDHSSCIATATTMKTRQTYSAIGSDRQAIIKLLAFSQVLLEKNPGILCCVMIKASRDLCRPYFYLPQVDMLLRTTCDVILDGLDPKEKVTGNFILSLILNHHFNYIQFPKLQAIKCGWRDVYEACQMKYNPYLKPQKYSVEKNAKPLLPGFRTSVKKQRLSSEYSAFCYT